jgi:hypothetical protein
MHLFYLTLLYPLSAVGAWDKIHEQERIYRYHAPLALEGNRFSKDELLTSREKLLSLTLTLEDPAERAHCHYLLSLIEWHVCRDAQAARHFAAIALSLNGHRGAQSLLGKIKS